ncbi:MAG: hypothetical protein KGI69_01750 [Patescibacteria group bacterium]|nr:hypothetical protein [Patescibacteria group bacterium]
MKTSSTCSPRDPLRTGCFLYPKSHGTITAMQNKIALGVDIGNVIIDNRSVDPEAKKVDEATYASFPPTRGVFEALKSLNSYFQGDVYLISKCTEWAQEQILLWLKDHDFYARTGIKPENVFFVRQRHEKDGVCRKLGLTHFIDDRLEVLGHMVGSTPNLILFQPDDEEVREFERFLPKVSVARDWDEAMRKIEKEHDIISP